MGDDDGNGDIFAEVRAWAVTATIGVLLGPPIATYLWGFLRYIVPGHG